MEKIKMEKEMLKKLQLETSSAKNLLYINII